MKRKPIQLVRANAAAHEFDGVFYMEILTALCDDGTIWEFRRGNGEKEEWFELPPIPQDQSNEETKQCQ